MEAPRRGWVAVGEPFLVMDGERIASVENGTLAQPAAADLGVLA
jgi:hypothetical protein